MGTELSPTEFRSVTTGLPPSRLDWLRYRSGQLTFLTMIVIWILYHAQGELSMPVRLIITGMATFSVALRISPQGGPRKFRKGVQRVWADAAGWHERSKWRAFGFGMYGPRGQRPAGQLGSRTVLTCGELLIVLGWTLFVAVFGATTFLVTGQLHEDASDGFHLVTAASAVVGAVLLLVCDVGFHLAGFVSLPRNAVGWLNKLLAIAIATVSAGYDGVLEHAGWLSFTWVPIHTWHGLASWHMTWLAVLISIPLGAIWLMVYLNAVQLVGSLARRLLGRENAVGETLQDTLPVGARAPE